MADVGTRKVYENDDVVLWENFLKPGEKTKMHTHTRDYLFYVVEGSTIKVFDAEGNEAEKVSIATGQVVAFRLRGKELVVEGVEGFTVPATHMNQNVGDTPYREIVVELKRPSSGKV
jgi:redox-sensitive bicupin YhaK (pirin superfamily)